MTRRMSLYAVCRRCRSPRSRWLLSVLLALTLASSSAFTSAVRQRVARPKAHAFSTHIGSVRHLRIPPFPSSATSPPTALSALPTLLPDLDLPTLLTSVETFDGSTIVDPVVVSGAFWAGLKGKIISLIIGQVLAAIVFAALASAVAGQLPKVGTFVGNLFKDETAADGTIKASVVSQFATSSADAVKSQTANLSPDVGKLLLCLLIDAIGTSSELIPVLGEVTDVVWAPIAALVLRSLYGSNVVFALEFAEEILPFTDVIPLATLCWVIETFAGDGDLAKALGIGNYGVRGGTVIDAPAQDQGQGRDLAQANDEPARRR